MAEELVKLFARVGIPEEILTDQGTNFTSQLLTEIYHLLHIHPIRTTPYHPQTDGLVERFNINPVGVGNVKLGEKLTDNKQSNACFFMLVEF